MHNSYITFKYSFTSCLSLRREEIGEWIDRKRQREGQRHRETGRERETDIEKETDRERERERERESESVE